MGISDLWVICTVTLLITRVITTHEPPSKPEILKLKPKQGPEISERCDYGLQAGGRRLPGGTLGFYKGSMRVARRVLTMIPYIYI